jgi:hypothetical protein
MVVKKYHAYVVKWRDSSTLRGWSSMEGDHSVAVITSVGWMVKETKTALTLTTGISEHGNVCDAITIPRETVTKITKLKSYIAGP